MFIWREGLAPRLKVLRCLLWLLLVSSLCLVEPLRVRAAPLFGLPSLLTQKGAADLGPNDSCLKCHGNPDFSGRFENGESISLYVDIDEYQASVHGPAGLNCVACHTDLVGGTLEIAYPHRNTQQLTCVECHGEGGGTVDTTYAAIRVDLPFADHREMTLDKNESCRSCHAEEYEVSGPSAHVRVFEGGNRDSALCVDCHDSHTISSPDEPREEIARICGDCHTAVYSTYRSSVHGADLETGSNPDVPTCVDCHGVHDVRGPRDPSYRNDSITICGDCHSDADLCSSYDISGDVVYTYLDDFHGRTVDLSRRFNRDVPSNKAVCFDCHGIHNIREVTDPLSMVYNDNVQKTCQSCHTNASASFADAWLNHRWPKENQGVYYVNLAYDVLTPMTIGGFLVYIGLDMGRRTFDKYRKQRRARALAEKELEENNDR